LKTESECAKCGIFQLLRLTYGEPCSVKGLINKEYRVFVAEQVEHDSLIGVGKLCECGLMMRTKNIFFLKFG